MKITLYNSEEDEQPSIKYHYVSIEGVSTGYISLKYLKEYEDIGPVFGILKISTYKTGEVNIEVIKDCEH